MHTSNDSYLLGVQYRPPAPGETQSIDSLDVEINQFRDEVFGVFLIGDFNAHSIQWLHFSSHESREGHVLRDFCQRHSLTQCVHQPTRNAYLLDLVLTDMPDDRNDEILPLISDHALVLCHFKVQFENASHIERLIFDYHRAN